MTTVSRLQLDHPALGTAGGSGLHASIEAIYTKIGNNIATRILTAIDLNNSDTATVTHDFKTAFSNLRYDLYLYDESTTALTRVTSTTSPALSAFTIAANGTNPTTQIDITNSSGAQRDLALVVIADPLYLREGDIKDIDITTAAPTDRQGLIYNSSGTKFVPNAVMNLVETTLSDRSIGEIGVSDDGYGALSGSHFPTPANVHFYYLDSNSNDNSANTAINLTQNGSPIFVGKGFYGRENLIQLDSIDDYLSSTSSSLAPSANESFSIGLWIKPIPYDYLSGNTRSIFIFGDDSSDKTIHCYFTSNTLKVDISSNGSSYGSSLTTSNMGALNDWIHVCFTYSYSGTLATLYVNGQVCDTATVTSLRAPTNSTKVKIGTGLFLFKGLMQDLFIDKGDCLTEAQVLDLYSKRYSGAQISAGHHLTANSFPITTLTNKICYYTLQNANDGSSNAVNLTNNNTVPFTGLGITGAAETATFNGTNQSLSSTNSFFNPGNNRSFAMGGWFAPRLWQPASDQFLIGNAASGSDLGFGLYINATGLQAYCTNTAGSVDFSMTLSEAFSLLPGSWHHVAMVFNYERSQLEVYLDGAFINATYASNVRSLTSSTFRIGAINSTAASFFKGKASNVFFIKDYAPNQNDIMKLCSARIDLSGTAASLSTTSRRWLAWHRTENTELATQIDSSWLLDQKASALYVNFGQNSDSRITLKCYEVG